MQCYWYKFATQQCRTIW